MERKCIFEAAFVFFCVNVVLRICSNSSRDSNWCLFCYLLLSTVDGLPGLYIFLPSLYICLCLVRILLTKDPVCNISVWPVVLPLEHAYSYVLPQDRMNIV